jgi:hypothetical protein
MTEHKTVSEFQSNGAAPPPEIDQSDAQTEPDEPAYFWAADVQDVAEELIGELRRELRDATILYAWSTQEHKRGGRPVVTNVRKFSTLEQFLYTGDLTIDVPDFLVIVDRKSWLAHTSVQWRRAAVYDALMHCGTKTDTEGNETWTVRAPTVQTYPEVVKSFGAWTDELAETAESFKQMRLFEPEPVST